MEKLIKYVPILAVGAFAHYSGHPTLEAFCAFCAGLAVWSDL